ncbi:hypothetical protein K438DRAFT_1961061 [Mycena galopus ATCC 62051]|nr:hypothetical protein K438DRAFT_1961061 [Mycena galopus ATCC 62051]
MSWISLHGARISSEFLQRLLLATRFPKHEINILALTFIALFKPTSQRTPHITQLEFGYVNLTSDQLRTVILRVPSITHLKLRDCNYCFDDGLAGALYGENGVAPVLPHLHNLVFKVDEDKYASTEANLTGIIAS